MRNRLISALFLAGSTLCVVPAQAQTANRSVEGRVDRLEGEMRAVQRKVFPGGSGQYVEPDNQPAGPAVIAPSSSASPVADLAIRVDSLETQLRGITGQVEAEQHRLQLLEDRIKALEANAVAPAAPLPSDSMGGFNRPNPDRSSPDRSDSDRSGPDRSSQDRTATDRPAPDRAADRPGTLKPVSAKGAVAPPPVVNTNDPERGAKLAAIERPDSGDVAEDTYLYGYRLWAAKLYPEAEAQFTTVTTKFASHKRASYAQNLLGRSYLEDGKPSLASLAFYDNYKKWPDGDRAPESLYYLAQALVKLDKPAAQVCKVYTELQRSYGAKVDADPKMKAGVAKGRAASNCS